MRDIDRPDSHVALTYYSYDDPYCDYGFENIKGVLQVLKRF
jgi:hypothetical protein